MSEEKKFKYLVYYESGNGYHCSCCRRSSDELDELDTLDEAMERVAYLKAFADADDYVFDALYKSEKLDATISQDKINALREERKQKKEEREKKEKAKLKSDKIKREKEQLAKLKEKYESESK